MCTRENEQELHAGAAAAQPPAVEVGQTLAQVLAYLWVVQRACEIQMVTQGKGALRPIPVPVLEAWVRDALNFNPRYGAGEDGFAAMQRLIDRKDPGYRA